MPNKHFDSVMAVNRPFFFYGSLKRGERPNNFLLLDVWLAYKTAFPVEYAAHKLNSSTMRGRIKTQSGAATGNLYAFYCGFPGAFFDVGSNKIQGDIVWVPDWAYKRVLTSVRQIEGYHINCPDNLYEEKLISVLDEKRKKRTHGNYRTCIAYSPSKHFWERMQKLPRKPILVEDGNWYDTYYEDATDENPLDSEESV